MHLTTDPNKEKLTLCGLDSEEAKRGAGTLSISVELFLLDPKGVQELLEYSYYSRYICKSCAVEAARKTGVAIF